MASFLLDTTATTTQNLTGTEAGLLGQNGAILVLGANAINANSDNDLVINGTVATDFYGISSTGSALKLLVGSQGNILSTGSYGVVANVSGSTEIVNNGTISSAKDYGVGLLSSDTSVSHRLTNTGTISGEDSGILIEARGAPSIIVNSGTISGGYYGISGNYTTNAVLSVWNTGTITSAASSFYGNEDDGSGTSSDRVHNAGVMQGDIYLLSGDDLYDGFGGMVTGTVFGGLGDDTYIIDDSAIRLGEYPGEGTDEVKTFVSYALEAYFETLTLLGAENIDGTGNGDANTLTGNAGANLLQGLGGHDTLEGGAGKDELIGGGGNDELNGDDGDDLLLGRLGNDTLSGGNGDDTLVGGPGTDNLGGGPGNDVLFGGPGADVLNGGSGQDRFVFTKLSDTPAGTEDKIYGFVSGEDTIDLSHLFADPLAMAIGGAFTGTGPSARTTEVGADTRVMIDIDGDSTIDMRLIIKGALGLSEADFFL